MVFPSFPLDPELPEAGGKGETTSLYATGPWEKREDNFAVQARILFLKYD